MAQIPMPADVAAAVGKYGERIENRSLLLDKFVFHKSWPVELDETGKTAKWDDATRTSFMRIANQSRELVTAQAVKMEQDARGRNVGPEKAQRLRTQAAIARHLANIKWDDQEVETLRARHSRRFLKLLATALPGRHVVLVAQLEARLAINLSDSLIQNAGISLDRLFGLPVIPGSAVKGVCRHAALAELKAAITDDDKRRLFRLFQQVFGTSSIDFVTGCGSREKKEGLLAKFARYLDVPEQKTVKGCIDFLSAHPVNTARITVDLTTVHYPDYYHSGRTEDLSRENPRPNPFPVVEQGARFAFCLVANRLATETEESLAAAGRWLSTALTVQGMGAKTASGYGWFSLPADGMRQLEEDERMETERMDHEARLARERAEEAERQREAREAEATRARQRRELEEHRKSMSAEEIADETVRGWNDDAFRARLRNFVKSKGAPSEAQKQAIVRACRGERMPLWNELKQQAIRGDLAKCADAVRALSKSMNLGKMP